MFGVEGVIRFGRVQIQLLAHIADQVAGRRQRFGCRFASQTFDQPGADHDGIGHLGDGAGRGGIADAEPDTDRYAHMATDAPQRVLYLSQIQRAGAGDALDGNAVDIATSTFGYLPDAALVDVGASKKISSRPWLRSSEARLPDASGG